MIITFQGGSSKDGTTMISQSVAELMAKENAGERILYLIFAPNRGRTFISEEFEYLDSDIRRLKKNITADLIYDNCLNQSNLYIYGGISKRFKVREFMPYMAEGILTAAKKEFKHIIIDAGNTMDFGLSMPKILNMSDRLYYVFSHGKASIDEFIDVKSYFKEYRIEPDGYIVNRFDEGNVLTTVHISEQLNIPEEYLTTLPYIDKAHKAELEKKTFVSLKDKVWIKAIRRFTDKIAGGKSSGRETIFLS